MISSCNRGNRRRWSATSTARTARFPTAQCGRRSGQREALFLRFYLDLDYASIADVLDIEVGTVSATLHAARAALAQALKEVST
jgi:DNA-directed RNA polymerase specialized sigma24 family protein